MKKYITTFINQTICNYKYVLILISQQFYDFQLINFNIPTRLLIN